MAFIANTQEGIRYLLKRNVGKDRKLEIQAGKATPFPSMILRGKVKKVSGDIVFLLPSRDQIRISDIRNVIQFEE